ncbi:MAG: hypothetical protein B6D39_04730 [Anaerolineae bacterium UTCFX2]|jgi:exonuclease SbcC|nr:SMC family ATPase [Anaerolineales bacterium]OQY92625.1 MAG: hypothetical protein B6D39_04730 [Anaerolineae bacterium UTCFX2]
MIPIRLSISGFLSYREPAELDFTGFDLACVAGPNGAGKSSLLDAITWALFGQARKRDDSIIHVGMARAEVGLIFAYEGNIYQVRRIKPREKTMALEFQILQDGGGETLESRLNNGSWKALSERTLRDTEAMIQHTLRMDYDTFINASFFLQGKADNFTQQRPGDRKRILSSILGLDAWEDYRQCASERRRAVKNDISGLDGQLREIQAELAEEPTRRLRLSELQTSLEQLSQARQSQETNVQNARQVVARLEEQKQLVEALHRQSESSLRRLEENCSKLDQRRSERETFTAIIERSAQIQAEHAAWTEQKTALEQMEEVAERFRQHEKQREEPRMEIQAERARLEQELRGLQNEKEQLDHNRDDAAELQRQLEPALADLAAAEARLDQRLQLEVDVQSRRQSEADLRAENSSLKPEMEQLDERIKRLVASVTAECPLCGQPLLPDDRSALIERLTADGRRMGDRFRENKARLQELTEELRGFENQVAELSQVEVELRKHTAQIAQLKTQLEAFTRRDQDWQQTGALRLQELQNNLAAEQFALPARQRLAKIDAELKKIGYDAAAHDAARQAEEAGRASEAALRELDRAQAALAPLAREIDDLEKMAAGFQAESQQQKSEYEKAAELLAEAEAQAPDVFQAESRLRDLQEQENRAHMELGAAQQRVAVLDSLKTRRAALEAQRETLAHKVQLLEQLERAFGKDGVPALLIEQALPEIESKANETLARLSGGGMSVRFITQAQYKDKSRGDLKETLDIQISDNAGTRDYELFSGGEAFRVNFAIRLALSEVLAQRAGARLQTLVIDEGFGSQDALGRQRLIEAINLVQADFAKILVITHIDELKDVFPNRIEVEKTELGSAVRVI